MLKILFLSIWFAAHPIHVSLMSVEYFDKKDLVEVFIKLHYEDFITDYWYSINDDQIFETSGKIDTTVVLINKYLEDKIQIFADDKKLRGALTRFESTDGEVKMSILFNYRKRAKNIKVKNLILTDVYKDQSNLLIFRYNDFEEGVKLTPEKLEHSFKIE
jgi:hypothetical protein